MDSFVPRRLQRYRHVLDEYRFAATIADASREDCPIIWANARFFALTGYPPETVLGRNCRFLQSQGSCARARRRLRAAIATRRPVDVLVENVTAAGRPFLNHLLLRPLHGGADLIVGAQNDVTGWIVPEPLTDARTARTDPPGGPLRADMLARWIGRLGHAATWRRAGWRRTG
ncbi:MAG: PAS domain-containing protein [Pseudomonadota bacterium]